MNTYLTPDLIFFILVAAFLILRLRSVLGRRTGNEKKPKDAYYYQDAAFDENQKKKSNIKAYKKPLNALEKNKGHISGMEKIVILDSNFNPKKFLSGAKVAFQKIIQSYANNEIDKIKYLLSNTVFSTFSKKISYRLKKKIFFRTHTGFFEKR